MSWLPSSWGQALSVAAFYYVIFYLMRVVHDWTRDCRPPGYRSRYGLANFLFLRDRNLPRAVHIVTLGAAIGIILYTHFARDERVLGLAVTIEATIAAALPALYAAYISKGTMADRPLYLLEMSWRERGILFALVALGLALVWVILSK